MNKYSSEDTCETAPALLAIFGVTISCMAAFFSILKRKTRGSSSSSESGALTPKEKRFCEPSFEAEDEVNIALDIAEDFGSKLQLVLQKLTSLESMVEGVLQRFNNLESSVNCIKGEALHSAPKLMFSRRSSGAREREDSHMKQTGMFVVSSRVVNFGFWSRLGCSGQSANILCHQGLV